VVQCGRVRAGDAVHEEKRLKGTRGPIPTTTWSLRRLIDIHIYIYIYTHTRTRMLYYVYIYQYMYITIYVCKCMVRVRAHACKRETCVFVCVGLWPTFILKYPLCAVCPAPVHGGVGRRVGGLRREELLLVCDQHRSRDRGVLRCGWGGSGSGRCRGRVYMAVGEPCQGVSIGVGVH